MIVFEMCNEAKTPTIKCKTKTELKQFLKNKYLVTLENSSHFISHRFDEKRVNKKAEIKWYWLSTTTRLDYVNMITRESITL